MARAALTSLRNEDYSDRELLHILLDKADDEGWTTTFDLMDALRLGHPDADASDKEREKRAKHCIGTRFSWMVRYKWVERDEETRTKWRPSEAGHDLMNGRLTKAVERALAGMKPADRILAMRMLTMDYNRAAPDSIMLRREWQHGTGRG